MISHIQNFLSSIPDNYRAVFYCLPLLFSWLPGITFEKDQMRLLSVRSLLISAAFLVSVFLLFLFESFIWTDSIATRYARELFLFLVHSVLSISYLAVSFLRAYRAFHDGAAIKEPFKFPVMAEDFIISKLQSQ